jgi:transcriptional regulator with XRE-family HTH domain
MDERHNAALRAMLAEMVDMGYNQGAIGQMLGCGQSHISNIMQGRNGGSVNMALKLAEILGKDPVSMGLPSPSGMTVDPMAHTFLARLGRARGLSGWVSDNRDAISLSQLVHVVDAYSELPESDKDPRNGVPRVGWDEFIGVAIESDDEGGTSSDSDDHPAAQPPALAKQVTGHVAPPAKSAAGTVPPKSLTKPAPGVTPVTVLRRNKSE